MAYNPSAPACAFSVYFRRPTDATWTNVTSIIADWTGFMHKFNAAKTIMLTVDNINGNHDNWFHVGDNFRIFAGWDAVYPQPIITGKIYPNGISHNESTIDITVNDYTEQLSYEQFDLSNEGMNYNGWECGMAIEDIVLSLRGQPLTSSLCGTYPTMLYITPANKIEGEAISKLEAVRKILDVMVDVDWNNQNRPLKYYYYQYDDYDGANYTPRFKLIKELDPTTATANKVLNANTNAFIGSTVSNDDFYNMIRVNDKQVVQDDDSIARNGLYGRTMASQYSNPVQNMDVASALLWTSNKVSYSYKVTVRDWPFFNLGDVVAVSNMRNGLFNGNHIVTEMQGDMNLGTITLSNAISDISLFFK
jgi:hypothetical protein